MFKQGNIKSKDVKNFKNKHIIYAVYFIYKGNNIVYIGKTTNIHRRLMEHKTRFKFDEFNYIECIDNAEMRAMEFYYISNLRPKYNVYFKDTSFWSRKELKNKKKELEKQIDMYLSVNY